MKIIIFTVSILTYLYFILNVFPVFAQSKILINEFLIDPQPQSVEIFNSGTESANISNWIIDDSGGTTFYTIPKDSLLFPNQCLVFSGDFNLNKTSADTVKLINNDRLLVDSFSYKSSSGSGISYFRLHDGSENWGTGSANLGFYNQTNNSCLITPSPTITLIPTLTPTPTITPTIIPTIGPEDLTPTLSAVVLTEADSISYESIYISEVMVNPQAGENEWVEIYNDNDFLVFLNNWHLDDLENAGSSPKTFSLVINEKSYAVFNLSTSMFNNDGDSVRLLDFNKNLKDSFEYQDREQGKTLGRTSFESDDFCLQEPSKNSVNNPCINPTPTTLFSTGSVEQVPTKIIQTKTPTVKTNNFDISINRSINYPTGTAQNISENGDVLGISSGLINAPNSKSSIKLLCFLSTSYSLLTIISILFKMRSSYGKNKNFYSPSFHSS